MSQSYGSAGARPSRVSPLIFSTTLVSTLVLAAGCGKGLQDSAGRIAKVDGKVVQLSDAQAEEVCSKQYCEPNYLYSIDFGSARPKPKPKPKPALPAERLDYSRTVLQVADAWKVSKGSRDVVVAVVDTGVDLSQPDLKDNIWTNYAELYGQPGVDDDGNGYVDDVHGYDFYNNRPNGVDDNMHGTHCAGIIGAEENGIGTVGISPLVKIMPLKFLGAFGSGDTAAAVKAIHYAIDNGAQVISNSWGGGGYSEFLNEAIQEAVGAGILVVAAAGNNSSDNDYAPNYPASYAGVIAVASSNEQDGLSGFSNYGVRQVTIAAPGSDIYSSVIGSKWQVLSGTSMATPQVAGALALAKAANPGMSADDLKTALCDTSNKILLDKVKCGRMNVGQFVGRVAGGSN